MTKGICVAVLLFCVAVEPAAGQSVPPSPPADAAAPQTGAVVSVVPSGDYRVGPQDVLNITVYGEEQLSGRIRIDNDGTFPFQYLNRVKAEGLTTLQIESTLRTALADGYLRNPQVSVEVVEYRSQSVFVTGEVRLPSKYSLPGYSTLMDVLTLAGSVTSNAGSWVLITRARQGAAQGPAAVENGSADLRVSLKDIQSGKAQNISIRDGDTIFVPKAERVWVVGHVRNAGGITYEEGMTVFAAVSAAGGITEKGSNRFSIRRLVNGRMREIDAKAEDILQPGDQVNVRPRRL
jgi:polysaccharide biosynthesis/export protein